MALSSLLHPASNESPQEQPQSPQQAVVVAIAQSDPSARGRDQREVHGLEKHEPAAPAEHRPPAARRGLSQKIARVVPKGDVIHARIIGS